MGNKSKRTVPQIIYNDGEGFVSIGSISSVSEFTEIDDEPNDMITSLEPIEIHGTFKLGKHLRCKSRKRFIKLLMSHGYPRKEANAIAFYMRDLSYQQAWCECFDIISMVKSKNMLQNTEIVV